MKKFITKEWRNQWNGEWIKERTKLHEIRESIFEKVLIPEGGNRQEEATIIRMTIGHTNFSHTPLITKDPQTECQNCNCPITVKYILIACPNLANQRAKAQVPTNKKTALNTDKGLTQV